MDREPVQAMKERDDMIKFGATEDASSSMILNFLVANRTLWPASTPEAN